MGISVVLDGVRVATRSWLCRPPASVDFFAYHNVRVHGISAHMVAYEPEFAERWPGVVEVVADLPLVAHNAGFDSGAVREACGLSGIDSPSWEFSCSLALARRHLDLDSYRLPHVAEALGVELISHHNAAADAQAAADIVVALARRAGVGSLAELERMGEMRVGRAPRRAKREAAVPRERRAYFGREELVMPEVFGTDPGHPLYGQIVVFTGDLAGMSRQQAWDAIAACGAVPAKNVTRRTTCLVVGDGFSGDDAGMFTTTKARRVVELRAKGHRIDVLDEGRLVSYLGSTVTSVGSARQRDSEGSPQYQSMS